MGFTSSLPGVATGVRSGMKVLAEGQVWLEEGVLYLAGPPRFISTRECKAVSLS